MAERGDGFYVGYAASAPPAIRRFVRRAVAGVLGATAALALLLAALQRPFAPSAFEYGAEREFVGWVRESPTPLLLVPGPDCEELCAPTSSYYLTRYQTKQGAADLVRGLEGRQVRLRGVLVYFEDQTLLDVVPGSVEPIEAAAAGPITAPAAEVRDLGPHTLEGEVVDGKCYLGVMRPGLGKVHRACAARCISSGSPPLLVVRDAQGRLAHLLLVGSDGRSLQRELLPFVAEPVRVTGRVLRYDDLLVLRTEPRAIHRL
jgi:hypothetical protein